MSLRPSESVKVRRRVVVDARKEHRRRITELVEIRKQQKEDILKKRRLPIFSVDTMLKGSESLPDLDNIFESVCFELAQSCDDPRFVQQARPSIAPMTQTELEKIQSLINMIHSDKTDLQFVATQNFRELLFSGSDPLISQLIQSGIVQRLVHFLTKKDSPKLQLEAAWALTNIAYGASENTKAVIDHGAVPIFVNLLQSEFHLIADQVAWALCNIAGDSTENRDIVISSGAFLPLVAHLDRSINFILSEHVEIPFLNRTGVERMDKNIHILRLRKATWMISMFLRGKPQLAFEQVNLALPMLDQLIKCNQEDVVADACETVSYLCDSTDDIREAVVQAAFCTHLIGLLRHGSPLVLTNVLTALGNVVLGGDKFSQLMVNLQILPNLQEVLSRTYMQDAIEDDCTIPDGNAEEVAQYIKDHYSMPCLRRKSTENYDKSIKGTACWIISCIASGNKAVAEGIIGAGLVGSLVNVARNSNLFDVKKEAAWAISNILSSSTEVQVERLVDEGCLEALCCLLDCHDPLVQFLCLKGIEKFLARGEDCNSSADQMNIYASKINDIGGLEKIELLLSHENTEISESAAIIIDTYWAEHVEND